MEKRKRFTCKWIYETLVVLCDGKVVCGCGDPTGIRELGNIHKHSLEEIWNSEKVQKIRKELNEGYSSFCGNCCIREFVDEDTEIEQRPIEQKLLPRLFVEPTVICNLSCHESICKAGGDLHKTRSHNRLSLEDFKMVIDQLGSNLGRLELFNFGEPFLHPQAVDMVEYVKEKYPSVYIFTSTNGLMLNEEKIDRLVRCGIDEVTFSIDGNNQETYEKYRCGGDFEKAVSLLKMMADKKQEYNRLAPFITWRYILFKWNHSRKQMKQAVKLAEEAGADRFCWEITDQPKSAKSDKYQVGTKAWHKIYYELWDSGFLCNAIKSRKYKSKIKRISPKPEMVVDSPGKISLKIKNVGGSCWYNVTDIGLAWVRVGAQLHDENKNLINMDYSRSFIKRVMYAGDEDSITMSLPPINEAGNYYLKFDMVSEGRQWFEKAGDSVTWVPLKIVEK